MSVTIWHNPRCSKSRHTLELLKANGVDPEIRLYAHDAPSEAEIHEVLGLLGMMPRELMRVKDALYKGLDLQHEEGEALIKAMAANPMLIERPIVFANGKAAIGRPPEAVLAIL